MNLKSIRLSLSVLLSVCFVGNVPAFAWNNLGHMAVAAVAYDRLKPKTKARVMELLKINPLYEDWNDNLPSRMSKNSRNRFIFMNAATWPDIVRGSKYHYDADGDKNGEVPVEPIASQNIGYEDHNLHKYWHYDDNFFSKDGTELPSEQKPNAKTQIEVFRKVLSSDAKDELKSYDLTWLLHLTGDVHQPLHTASLVSAENPEGDAGGNLTHLAGGKGLHSYWDATAGVGKAADALEYAQGLESADELKATNLNDEDWLKESFELAKNVAYGSNLKKLSNGKYRINDDYEQQAADVARQQIELAGERLANVLNQELK